MYLTAITHASARYKAHNFRGLTTNGQEESAAAARQFEAYTMGWDLPPVDRIVSSPKPRCLETVILFAKGLNNSRIAASSVDVDAGLAAGKIKGDELAALAASSDAAHNLVSGHADLVKTLPSGVSLGEGAADGGWFAVRPVLFHIEVEPGQPWDAATVHFCTALVDGQWRRLLGA